MNKQIITVFCLLLLTVASWAAPLSKDQAQAVARQFIAQREAARQPARSPGNAKNVSVSFCDLAAARPGAAQPAPFYVFNVGRREGFVIVAADDGVQPIFGYSDSGAIDPLCLPDGLLAMMQCWNEEVDFANSGRAMVSRPQTSSSEVIQPLLATVWDQGAPFNLNCPKAGNTTCPTGCVATAMAQVVRFHEWPQSVAAISGYRNGNMNLESLPATTFNYSLMASNYNGYTTGEQKSEVAKLMQYCGWAVRMGYGADASGAQDYNLADIMMDVFQYADGARMDDRGSHTIAEWDELVTNELSHRRPIYYSAYTSQSEGHAFVIDGRDANGLFHVNWGWGGVANGYYRISVLLPSMQGIGGSASSWKFSCSQKALLGLSRQRATDLQPVDDRLVTSRPYLTDTQLTRTSSSAAFPNVSIGSYLTLPAGNGNTYSARIYYAWALYSGSQLVKTLGSGSNTFWFSYPEFLQVDVSFPQAMADGTYQLRPVFRRDLSDQWQLVHQGDINFVEMQVSGNSASLITHPSTAFQVTRCEFKGNELQVDIVNPDGEYNDAIYLYDQNFNLVSYEEVAIPANSPDSFSIFIPSDNKITDDDVFFLSTSYPAIDSFYTNMMVAGSRLSNSLSILNAQSAPQLSPVTQVVGDKVMARLNISNQGTGRYLNFVSVDLMRISTNSSVAKKRQKVDLAPGASTTLLFEFPLKGSYYGQEFCLRLTTEAQEAQQTLTTEHFTPARGAIWWNANGQLHTQLEQTPLPVPQEATAVNLRGVSTSDITPNDNPNTLYMLDTTVPSSLQGYNIVNADNMTGYITLHDGYDYFFPVAVFAQNAVYKRTFTAAEKNQWSTLWLPFTPDQFTADNNLGAQEEPLFWFCTIAGLNADRLVIDDQPSTPQGDMPLLIAPSATLAGHQLSCSARSVTFPPSSPARKTLGGVTLGTVNAAQTIAGAYTLVQNPARFEPVSPGQPIMPFRVYVDGENLSWPVLSFSTRWDDVLTDAITTLNAPSLLTSGVYNVTGQKVVGPSPAGLPAALPKGLYIVGGKKVVKR